MNVILYLTIFIIGAILGTLTTLIVKTTLKEKVTRKRPYIVNAILSGIIFILFSISIKLNIKTIWALGIPGKIAPISSAEYIKETIYNIIKERNDNK